MQIADTNGQNRVSIDASSPATTGVVAVKGRAAACDVAQFGRPALASDMPPLRDTAQTGAREGSIRFRQAAARTSAIWHRYVAPLSGH
jgi:hypothetical protein